MRSDDESMSENFVLRLWADQVARSVRRGPRPQDSPRVRSFGPDPARLLLIGDGFAVGYGVSSHQLGLAGPLSRYLTGRTGRGIDIDVIGDDMMSPLRCLKALGGIDLARFDAVILSIGFNDAMTLAPEKAWRDNAVQLLTVLGDTAIHTFVTAIPGPTPGGDVPAGLQRHIERHVRVFNQALREECAGNPTLTFVPVVRLERRRRGDSPTPRNYEQWAAQIAPLVALPSVGVAGRPTAAQEESARQGALDRLGILDTAPEERFDRIVSTARNLLGTAGAALNFIDDSRQWTKSSDGGDVGDSPRSTAFCDVTIKSDALLVVEDASTEERFKDFPSVAGSHHIRFYAGYPIEDGNGIRVGALCVYDTEARTFSSTDAALLRDMAMQVQDLLQRENSPLGP
jgi:lysophospholipase L1-like esterase